KSLTVPGLSITVLVLSKLWRRIARLRLVGDQRKSLDYRSRFALRSVCTDRRFRKGVDSSESESLQDRKFVKRSGRPPHEWVGKCPAFLELFASLPMPTLGIDGDVLAFLHRDVKAEMV